MCTLAFGSNCMYESTEGRWSGDENVLAAIWEAIFMQKNSDMMGKMCLSVQEYGRFSLEQLVSILKGDICFCCPSIGSALHESYENDRPPFLFPNGADNSASLLEMLRNYKGSWNRCGFRKTGLQLILPSLGVYFLIKPSDAAGLVVVLNIPFATTMVSL